MTSDDVVRLAKALKVMGDTFNEPVSGLRADSYLMALSEFSIDEVEEACRRAITYAKWFPKPVELREWITGSHAESALLAWQELNAEVRRVGYVGRPNLPEATLEAITRVWGSWVALCQTLPAEGPGRTVWERRFSETYTVLATRARLSLPPTSPIPRLASSSRARVADGDT